MSSDWTTILFSFSSLESSFVLNTDSSPILNKTSKMTQNKALMYIRKETNYIYMHIYMDICMHLYIYLYAYTYIHVYICVVASLISKMFIYIL